MADVEADDRMVRVGDLVGVVEIAERVNREPTTVRAWKIRYPDFPEPLTQIGPAHVWDVAEIRAWHVARFPEEAPVWDQA